MLQLLEEEFVIKEGKYNIIDVDHIPSEEETTSMLEEEDGKKKKVLVDYLYNLGDCMFCQLCVNACPKDAITFCNDFENAVFDRKKLVQKLNK